MKQVEVTMGAFIVPGCFIRIRMAGGQWIDCIVKEVYERPNYLRVVSAIDGKDIDLKGWWQAYMNGGIKLSPQ